MFSGIVEELGEVKRISKRGNVALLEIKTTVVQEDAQIGESIAINGTCLTVINNKNNILGFEVMQGTLSSTNLGALSIGERVNLERALKVGDRISGHFVTGHIDCLGIIRSKAVIRGNTSLEIAVPQALNKQVFLKGSIAVDGISLTVAEKKANCFYVYIIPHTLKNTTLGFKGPSHKVNLEFDLLTKQH